MIIIQCCALCLVKLQSRLHYLGSDVPAAYS